MGLKLVNKKSFGLKQKNSDLFGSSVYTVKGGSAFINGKCVFFNDLNIDVQKVVYDYTSSLSNKVFSEIGGVLYVLIVLNDKGTVEVVPSVSHNKNISGNVKLFKEIPNKAPLFLVKLKQDGSSGLTGMMPVKPEDIEEYKGYGNITLAGPRGETGPIGETGFIGATGFFGITGYQGDTGYLGETGIQGLSLPGETGTDGAPGEPVLWPTIIRYSDPVAEFSGSPLSGNAPLTVDFVNLSTGLNIGDYSWSFGDGNYSSITGPQNIYTSPGTYSVTLQVSNEMGDHTAVKIDYVEVIALTYIQDTPDSSVDGWDASVDSEEDQIQNTPEIPS